MCWYLPEPHIISWTLPGLCPGACEPLGISLTSIQDPNASGKGTLRCEVTSILGLYWQTHCLPQTVQGVLDK